VPDGAPAPSAVVGAPFVVRSGDGAHRTVAVHGVGRVHGDGGVCTVLRVGPSVTAVRDGRRRSVRAGPVVYAV